MTEHSEFAIRKAVLTSAPDVLVKCGYEQTSLDNIADVAGISRATIDRQFSGKDDIVASLIREGYIGQDREDDRLPLDQWLMRFFKIDDTGSELPDSWFELLSMMTAPQPSQLSEIFRHNGVMMARRRLAANLARLGHEGCSELEDPDNSARSLVDAVWGMGSWASRFDPGFADRRARLKHMRFCVAVFCSGISMSGCAAHL